MCGTNLSPTPRGPCPTFTCLVSYLHNNNVILCHYHTSSSYYNIPKWIQRKSQTWFYCLQLLVVVFASMQEAKDDHRDNSTTLHSRHDRVEIDCAKAIYHSISVSSAGDRRERTRDILLFTHVADAPPIIQYCTTQAAQHASWACFSQFPLHWAGTVAMMAVIKTNGGSRRAAYMDISVWWWQNWLRTHLSDNPTSLELHFEPLRKMKRSSKIL